MKKVDLQDILSTLNIDEVGVIQTQENYTLYQTERGVLRVYTSSGKNAAVNAQNDLALIVWAEENGIGPEVICDGDEGDFHWHLLEVTHLPTDAEFPKFVKKNLVAIGKLLRRFHQAKLPDDIKLVRPEMGLDRMALVELFAKEAVELDRLSSYAAAVLTTLRNVSERISLDVISQPALVHLNLRAQALSEVGLTDFQCVIQLEKGDPDLRLVDLAKVIAEADLSEDEVWMLLKAYYGSASEVTTEHLGVILLTALTEAVMTLVYNEGRCIAHPPQWTDRIDSLLKRAI